MYNSSVELISGIWDREIFIRGVERAAHSMFYARQLVKSRLFISDV